MFNQVTSLLSKLFVSRLLTWYHESCYCGNKLYLSTILITTYSSIWERRLKRRTKEVKPRLVLCSLTRGSCINEHPLCHFLCFHYLHSTRLRNRFSVITQVHGPEMKSMLVRFVSEIVKRYNKNYYLRSLEEMMLSFRC